ncbi:MAG: FecR domain-containing protein [Rhodospirillales bacterium]
MNVFGRVLAVLSLGLLWSCGDGSRSSGPKGIGEVDVVVRVVRGTLANYDQARLLAVDDAVYWHEQIDTERDSATQMEFADGTRLTVGPDARVMLDEFVYGGPVGTDRMVLTVTKGISRFITGNMEKAAYEIRAPGAIIGVRGTDFTLVVDPEQGTTTCLVHHGEVSFRRSDGGSPVIIKPGQASKVVSRDISPVSPPTAPAPEVLRDADRLQNVIREASNSREQDRHSQEASASQLDTRDRRLSALQSPQDTRDRLSDLAQQIRTGAGSESGGRGSSGSVTGGSSVGTAAPAPAHTAVAPSPAPAATAPAASTSVPAQAPVSTPKPATAEPPSTIGGVQVPAARGLCTEGASCLAAPPPNRVTSPTRL